MIKRDGFWTGLVLGGILGIGFALLTNRMVESPEKGQSGNQGTELTEEDGKKNSEQDQSFQKDIAGKFNFSKKISQLEDALKKLRDDNP